ncbi:MAG TPA: hypothetical protein VF040_22995 [Ktedonobacterales bacterium]
MGSHASTNNANNATTLQPRRSIRRFDIFAEYNRLKGLDKGMDEPHAKGYGLWVAKVVASGGRRAGSHRTEPPGPEAREDGERHEDARKASTEQEWHELGGEPQTDALFEREIVQRMGTDFYVQVFAPAIAQAVGQGRSYESIRDTLRKAWTPAHS